MPVIYVDIVLAINLVMDYLILWTAARLGQIPTCAWRLLAGAAAGAVCSLTIFLPGVEAWLLTLLKFVFPLVILLVAFFPLTISKFFQAVVYFYLAAFVMGGAMLGAIYLFGGNPSATVMGGGLILSPNLRFTWLFAAGAAALLLARWGTGWIKKNFWDYMLRLPVVISFAGKQLALKALVDTGKSLRDPLSQQPVIIVEYSALKSILPAEIIREYSSRQEPDLERLVTSLAGSPWAARIRMLPYHSLGQSRGMLLGLRPDAVIIVTSERMVKLKNIIVGLYREQLSPQGNYRAIYIRICCNSVWVSKEEGLMQQRLLLLINNCKLKLNGLYNRLLVRFKLRGHIFYVGSSEALPPPLSSAEESNLLLRLEGGEAAVKTVLIERNLRLVVYIARKFENTGVGIEDLVSIGTIGLIKAVNTFDPKKRIKLATYASRCIENEILMYLRRNNKTRSEVSFDEPLNIDWDGNELLLSDVLGTENDIIYKSLEEEVDRKLLHLAMRKLTPRERKIMEFRFGLLDGIEKTQKEVADILGISQSYISRLEKRIIKRLRKEIARME